jgi:hypothetical protein
LPSCVVRREATQSRQSQETAVADSVSVLRREKVQPLVVPSASASLSLPAQRLDSLPEGASYVQREGRAQAAVMRVDEHFLFTASCDSLTLLVTELETEIYRLNRQTSAFNQDLNETKITEVRRLTLWDQLQIWVGRILLLLLSGYILLRYFKLIK